MKISIQNGTVVAEPAGVRDPHQQVGSSQEKSEESPCQPVNSVADLLKRNERIAQEMMQKINNETERFVARVVEENKNLKMRNKKMVESLKNRGEEIKTMKRENARLTRHVKVFDKNNDKLRAGIDKVDKFRATLEEVEMRTCEIVEKKSLEAYQCMEDFNAQMRHLMDEIEGERKRTIELSDNLKEKDTELAYLRNIVAHAEKANKEKFNETDVDNEKSQELDKAVDEENDVAEAVDELSMRSPLSKKGEAELSDNLKEREAELAEPRKTDAHVVKKDTVFAPVPNGTNVDYESAEWNPLINQVLDKWYASEGTTIEQLVTELYDDRKAKEAERTEELRNADALAENKEAVTVPVPNGTVDEELTDLGKANEKIKESNSVIAELFKIIGGAFIGHEEILAKWNASEATTVEQKRLVTELSDNLKQKEAELADLRNKDALAENKDLRDQLKKREDEALLARVKISELNKTIKTLSDGDKKERSGAKKEGKVKRESRTKGGETSKEEADEEPKPSTKPAKELNEKKAKRAKAATASRSLSRTSEAPGTEVPSQAPFLAISRTAPSEIPSRPASPSLAERDAAYLATQTGAVYEGCPLSFEQLAKETAEGQRLLLGDMFLAQVLALFGARGDAAKIAEMIVENEIEQIVAILRNPAFLRTTVNGCEMFLEHAGYYEEEEQKRALK